MQEQQHEGILKCAKHGVQGCVRCAEESALTRDLPSAKLEDFMNRHQRRVAESEARRSK